MNIAKIGQRPYYSFGKISLRAQKQARTVIESRYEDSNMSPHQKIEAKQFDNSKLDELIKRQESNPYRIDFEPAYCGIPAYTVCTPKGGFIGCADDIETACSKADEAKDFHEATLEASGINLDR